MLPSGLRWRRGWKVCFEEMLSYSLLVVVDSYVRTRTKSVSRVHSLQKQRLAKVTEILWIRGGVFRVMGRGRTGRSVPFVTGARSAGFRVRLGSRGGWAGFAGHRGSKLGNEFFDGLQFRPRDHTTYKSNHARRSQRICKVFLLPGPGWDWSLNVDRAYSGRLVVDAGFLSVQSSPNFASSPRSWARCQSFIFGVEFAAAKPPPSGVNATAQAVEAG